MSDITNGMETTKKWVQNEAGMWIEEDTGPVWRDKMMRWEWKQYFHQEEITKEEYVAEQKEFIRALNGHMG